MKILILTQVVDKNHAILGFFHRWIEEFAAQSEEVHVVALQVGEHSLPDNVTVHSLGKESGANRLQYIWRFLSLSWSLRKKYDKVFVHMNQIYVLLGWWLWKLLKKEIGFWYAHGTVTKSLKIAVALSDIMYTSTPEGLQIDTSKKKIVGQGIDTKAFSPIQRSVDETVELITVGRIARSKNIETLLKAVERLKQQGRKVRFTIIGVATTPDEVAYEKDMKVLTTELGVDAEVDWHGIVINEELPAYLQKSDIFIHDGATNSLDKTLVEAALCGCMVVSSNPAYRGETEKIASELLYPVGDYEVLAQIILNTGQQEETVSKITNHFKAKYSVSQLITNILNYYV